MHINFDKQNNVVEIWAKKNEEVDMGMIKKFKRDGSLVVVYRSGTGDLLELTTQLILKNR